MRGQGEFNSKVVALEQRGKGREELWLVIKASVSNSKVVTRNISLPPLSVTLWTDQKHVGLQVRQGILEDRRKEAYLIGLSQH